MQHFLDIYTFWKNNPNLWFNATDEDDKYISETFMTYYYDDMQNIDEMYKEEWTSYCILNDQLIKHFNRYYGINLTGPNYFIINCYSKYKEFKSYLNDFEFMFCLMPIRHTHELNHVKFVLNETWNRLSNDKNNQFIKKFLIATYERYIKLTKEDNLMHYINSDIVFTHNEILDEISPKNISIIACNHTEKLYNCMDEFIKNNYLINENIIVSISGGVDSMVCSYLLKQLTYQFKHLQISAL